MSEVVKRDQESPAVLARYFQQSGLFPDLQSEAQAYVKVVAGRELGLGPLASVSGLNVIKGRVTFSANLLASMVKRHPRYDYRVVDHSERSCRIVFTEAGQEIGVSTFTVEDAKRAGLGGQNWQKYPQAMLFARALTQGVRWYCPDVTAGAPAYSPEEIADGEVVEDVTMEATDRAELLEQLAAEIDDYEFDDEQRAAVREFVREGGDDAIRSALDLLREGKPSALFAGMTYEAEAAG
jgi:hypothetical protein